ncbi:AAA family ATPase [Sorangium sp. So ce1097]|uniref:AAA family ATPase n=1 Tax=Sorangium sp. So ce1097 TaxID=3133330 RepID=UPI003F64878C
MHPRIARLYINNYRCFVNFELQPGRRSLLAGYNGAGKSSIFDVLAAVQDLVAWNKEVSEAFPPGTVTKFGGSVEQRFEIDVASEWGVFRHALRVAHEPDRGEATIASEEVTLDGKPLYRFADREVQLYRDDHAPAGDAFSFSPRRSFLASMEPRPTSARIAWLRSFLRQIWVLRLDPARMTALARTDSDVLLARDASNFASFCRYLLQEEPDRLQRAQGALREIIPGFQHLRAQTAGRAKVLVARFGYPGGESYDLDFDALSDGQRALIVLYVLLHASLGTATVLCLDEPDNFVSIREIQPFLVELADVSDESGVQVLLISHSSEVIDYLGASETVLLERPEGGHTRVGSIASDGALRLSELMARGWHVAS